MKGKNKTIKYIIMGITTIVIVVLCIIAYNIFRIRKITDFYDNNSVNIESVSITSGNNGNIVYVSDEDYGAVTQFLSKLSFPGVNIGTPRDGWSYRISINQKNGESVNIMFQGDRCSVNGKRYNLSGGDEGFLDELFFKYYEK